MRSRLTSDSLELPPDAPISRRDRWRAAVYVLAAATTLLLVVLALVFEQVAATGVLLVVFLSFVLVYLIAPGVERLRRTPRLARRGRPVSRSLAVLAIYGVIGLVTFPIWTLAGPKLGAALERMQVLVPHHTTRFIEELHATERWLDTLRLPEAIDAPIASATRRITRGVEAEARALGAELAGIRRLVPWLSLVPVVAFVLVTRWTRFRRSTTRVLPTPHLQWRGNELLRNLNSLLAAYTRAQAMAAVIIWAICWPGFAALGVPYPGTLAIAAGLLETIPLAGPLVVAVVATAMAPDRVLAVLIFLALLRVVQDYAIYPRLISSVLRLHPVGVIVALWLGAAVGGVVGVGFAIPILGMLQVARRHWREYREIEGLVGGAARAAAVDPQGPQG